MEGVCLILDLNMQCEYAFIYEKDSKVVAVCYMLCYGILLYLHFPDCTHTLSAPNKNSILINPPQTFSESTSQTSSSEHPEIDDYASAPAV